MEKINLKDLLTIQETALETKKSESLLRKRIQDNKLSFVKIGYSVLIPRKEVEKIKKENEKS